MTYETILVETPAAGVSLIRLNRPQALNGLNSQLTREVFDAMESFDTDAAIKCIVLTGSDKAFAAGADIKQMENIDAVTMFAGSDFTDWVRLTRVRKPIIAAVSGWALGGGCEMAMMCDMIIASETAKFGQPEIKIGVMPGAGGTQRLVRTVGKAMAMEIILTGNFITAQRAWQMGLVNRVVPEEFYLEEALKLAAEIAEMSPLATMMAKEAILQSFETGLQDGLLFERKNYYLLFAGNDQKEGMSAFMEKRKAKFQGH